MQVRLHRLLPARQLSGIDFAVAVIVVLARQGIAAPLAVIGRNVHGAVAFPVGRVVGRCRCCFRLCAGRGGGYNPRLTGIFRCKLAGTGEVSIAIILTHWRVRLRQTKVLARRLVQVELKEGVVVEHLLDLLAQLECGQLQQADRLLQLWREGQMLRHAQ